MPSRLRLQTSIEEIEQVQIVERRSPSPPTKKQKMSLSQTYFVAASARTKLGREACRADHNLRLLVGHANLLDSLMVELHDAEREQEAWFNQTVQKAGGAKAEPKHIQWMDEIVEEEQTAEDDEDEMMVDDASETSDSDSEDEDEFEMPAAPRRLRQAPVSVTTREMSEDSQEDDDEYHDEEDDLEHALIRTPSGSAIMRPPELVDDSSDSEDESPPSSPPSDALDRFTEAQRQAIATTAFAFASDAKDMAIQTATTEVVDFADSGFPPLIAAAC